MVSFTQRFIFYEGHANKFGFLCNLGKFKDTNHDELLNNRKYLQMALESNTSGELDSMKG